MWGSYCQLNCDKKSLPPLKIRTKRLRVTTFVNSIPVHSFIDNGLPPEKISSSCVIHLCHCLVRSPHQISDFNQHTLLSLLIPIIILKYKNEHHDWNRTI